MSANNLANKRFIYSRMSAIAEASMNDTWSLLRDACHADSKWRGSHPFNEIEDLAEVYETFWRPLKTAFPDLERRDEIMIGGTYEGNEMVAAMGHYCGTHAGRWLDVAPTGKVFYLRYGEVYLLKDGKIAQSTVLVDILDFLRQAEIWPVAPSLGYEGMWPGPIHGDGIVLRETNPEESAASIAQTLAMHKALQDYDDLEGKGRDGLLNMPQREFWHPKMMWYGPAGIGTCRGLTGFVDVHQLPFRLAFPNRQGSSPPGMENLSENKDNPKHYIRVGDGNYSVTGGWPSVHVNHLGGGWLGMPATGKPLVMRVMDFYLHDENKIRENWVPLDILHVLLQMGFDVLARIRKT